MLLRIINKPNWFNLRITKPISKVFGLDRGLPIDRFFIEKFLDSNKGVINGTIMEVSDDVYSKKFGVIGSIFEVLHYANDNPKATIVGDLVNVETLPYGKIDCFICTQTLNFIYDVKGAIKGIHYVLKENGIALVTVAGICQISRYDMDRWGDYWRFTDLSIRKLFEEVFGVGNVQVDFYGNVLAAISFLHGLAADELTLEELLFKDQDYQILITVMAKKCSA
ncbi:methyltransferase domain-containing protein [Methylomonas montana]|uniref:methyltransferase domain-containing protein n=1 Tax=Methylomonas montana TaxID=3058963 RepID=UPI00387E5EA3